MGSIRVRRSAGSVRCAYCHDALETAEVVTCTGCGTLVHEDCQTDRCPTLGCDCLDDWAWTPRPAPRPRRPRRRRRGPAVARSPWSIRLLLGVASVASLALGYALTGPVLPFAPPPSPVTQPEPTVVELPPRWQHDPAHCNPAVHAGTSRPPTQYFDYATHVVARVDEPAPFDAPLGLRAD